MSLQHKQPGLKGPSQPAGSFVLRDFKGMNTQDRRTAIDDGEFAWLENLQPIGYGNLKSIAGPGGAEATLTGENIIYMKYVNIGNVDYMFIAVTSGKLYKMNLSTNAVTQINGANTFTTPYITQWKSERALIIDPSIGYFYYADPDAAVTVIDAAMKGTVMAVYAARVWIANGRVVSFSGPNAYTGVGGAAPAGAFTNTDSVLRKNIYAMEVANNFLYMFGDSAIYALADVRVDATSGATVFSNVLLETDTGTIYKTGVATLARTVIIADVHGIYGLFGAQPRRIGAKLDGIFGNIDFSQTPVVSLAVINKIQCATILVKYNDAGTTRTILLMWFDNKWFVASQGNALTFIAHGIDSGIDKLYATDGLNIFHIFDSDTVNVSVKAQTKLFDMGNVFADKAMMKFGLEANVSTLTTFNAVVDSLTGSTTINTLTAANQIVWLNSNGQTVTWLNNVLTVVTWIGVGDVFMKSDANGTGKYLGYTLTATSKAFTIVGLLGEYREGARW